MVEHKYIYDIEVLSVYDGDTIRVSIDLGFGLQWKGEDGKGVKLRLYGINTPEVRGKEKEKGLESKQALIDLLKGKRVILKTHKDARGKYGRYLATLFIQTVNETELHDGLVYNTVFLNVNDWLVENNFAKYKKY